MKIVLLGATGGTGKEVLAQALASGYDVTAVVRSPERLSFTDPELTVVQGDATDAGVLAKAMAGGDALISTLGSKGSTLITDSTRAIVEAAATTGLRRVIVMSSFAVNRDQLNGVAKVVTGLVMKTQVADKTAGESLLRESGLDWTIVHACKLTNEPRGTGTRVVPPTETVGLGNKVARADVAAWMLSQLQDGSEVGNDVTISQ